MVTERQVARSESDGGRMQSRATVAGFAALFFCGIAEASYGPAIPSLQSRFHLTSGGAGTIVGSHFAGIVAGSLLTGSARRWMARRGRVVTELGIFGVAWLLLAAAPTWPAALAAACAVGVGQGALVVEYNVAFAVEFGRRSASMAVLLNAAFGAGATVVPTAIGLLPGGGERVVWVTGGLMVLAIVPLARATPADAAAAVPHTGPAGGHRLFLVFSGIMFLYAGIEACVAAWETTYLKGRGYSVVFAATAVSFYWVAVTIGRLAGAAVVGRVGVDRLAMLAFLLGAPVVLITVAPPAAPAAFTLTGFVMAPLGASLFVWFQHRVPDAPALAGRFMAIAQGGAAVLPVAMGALMTVEGVGTFPWATAALFVAGGAGVALLRRAPWKR